MLSTTKQAISISWLYNGRSLILIRDLDFANVLYGLTTISFKVVVVNNNLSEAYDSTGDTVKRRGALGHGDHGNCAY